MHLIKLQSALSAPLLQRPVAAAAVLLLYLDGHRLSSSFKPLLESLGFTDLDHPTAVAMDKFEAMVSHQYNLTISSHFVSIYNSGRDEGTLATTRQQSSRGDRR